MDVGHEEQSILHENREGFHQSPSHENVSDGEDEERELEVMLYSQIYHEAPVAETNSPQQALGIIKDTFPDGVVEDRSTHHTRVAKAPGSDLSQSAQKNCRRSQFNQVGRTKPSRYYDAHANDQNCKPAFTVPYTPSKGHSTPSFPLKAKVSFSQQSLNILLTSQDSQRLPVHAKETFTRKSSKEQDKRTSHKNEDKLSEAQSSLLIRNSLQSTSDSKTGSRNSALVMADQICNNTDVSDSGIDNADRIDATATTRHDMEEKNGNVTKKQRQLNAQISQVVSSMLDDESYSAEDHQLVATRASEAAKSSNDSGWSVGMSWFDMSSSNFEVESVDSESLCSFPAQESSLQVESRTNTPCTPVEEKIVSSVRSSSSIADDHEEDFMHTNEQSRYHLLLKNDKHGNDSISQRELDSEEDSVVEMHVPARPKPVVVDVSDGDDYVGTEVSKVKPLKHDRPEDDILFLCARRGSKAARIEEIVVSDDDVLFIDKTKNSHGSSNCMNPTANVISDNVEMIPLQLRINASNEKSSQAAKNCPVKHKTSRKLNDWLHDPIKASRHLDHQKLLNKMSDDPELWKICYEDRERIKRSPRGDKCANCNQFGHKVKHCPQPPKLIKCYMCGTAGHRETRCSQKMCLNCGKQNNIYTGRCKDCSMFKPRCEVCQAGWHDWETCPDLWRRYHLTTAPGKIMQAKDLEICPQRSLWCSNCSKKGHLSHNCRAVYWKCEPICPFVQSYCTPAEEELRIRNGPSEATILLMDDDANILRTRQGNDFLLKLSKSKNISVNLNVDTTLKKLAIIGSSIDQAEARVSLMEWLEERKKSATSGAKRKAQQSNVNKGTIDGCTSQKTEQEAASKFVVEVAQNTKPGSQLINQAPNPTSEQVAVPSPQTDKEKTSISPKMPSDNIARQLLSLSQRTLTNKDKKRKGKLEKLLAKTSPRSVTMPPLPQKRQELRHFLYNKLFTIKQSQSVDADVVYSNILNLVKNNPSPPQLKKLTRLRRKLNIILLGVHRLGPGHEHVEALEIAFKRLCNPQNPISEIREQLPQHLMPLFYSGLRPDTEKLIKEYHIKKKKLQVDDVRTFQSK